MSTRTQTQARTDLALSHTRKLPTGHWKLAIIKGDAWVFLPHQDVILHTSDQLAIHNEDGQATIRSLYTRGMAQFTLSNVDCA